MYDIIPDCRKNVVPDIDTHTNYSSNTVVLMVLVDANVSFKTCYYRFFHSNAHTRAIPLWFHSSQTIKQGAFHLVYNTSTYNLTKVYPVIKCTPDTTNKNYVDLEIVHSSTTVSAVVAVKLTAFRLSVFYIT